jgi:small subunit ribosomal protein S4e
MAYLKRHSIPKNWSVPRKGTKYVICPESNIKLGVPVLILLRDLLKIAKNRKEVKKVIHERAILINGSIVKSEGQSLTLFDILTIVPSKENYKINLNEKGKFFAEKIKDADFKVSKVIKRTKLKNNKIQINLSDGRNFLSEEKCNTHDSALINLKKNQIEKILPLKEKAKIFVFAGKHTGKQGEVIKVDQEHKMIEAKDNDFVFKALIKQSIVIN